MTTYRAFEDKHGLVKFFGNKDIEFEVVLAGLASLKGSEKWGRQARDLETRFLRSFDGLVSAKIPEPKSDTDSMKSYLDALRCDDYFKPCDVLTFRKVHDECIRLFLEVSQAFSLLTKDDRRA